MTHQNRRRRLEALDEEAGFIVDREAEWALNGGGTALLQPGTCGVKQGGEDRGVIFGFDEAELANAVCVALAAQTAELRGDAACRPVAAKRKEEFGIGMPEIGIPLRVDMLQALDIERRHPVGIVGIDRERYVQEDPKVFLAAHRSDADGLAHGYGLTSGPAELKLGEDGTRS